MFFLQISRILYITNLNASRFGLLLYVARSNEVTHIMEAKQNNSVAIPVFGGPWSTAWRVPALLPKPLSVGSWRTWCDGSADVFHTMELRKSQLPKTRRTGALLACENTKRNYDYEIATTQSICAHLTYQILWWKLGQQLKTLSGLVVMGCPFPNGMDTK